MNANCSGRTDMMFPPESKNRDRRLRNKVLAQAAKDICEGCPARNKCTKLAVEVGETAGVWGGIWFADVEDVRASLPRNAFKKWERNKYRKPGLKSDYR